MKKGLTIMLILVFGILIYVTYFKQSYLVSTLNIVVLNKSDAENQFLEVSSLHSNMDFKIKIDDENVWNLIEENEEYFVSVKFDGKNIEELPGKTAVLQQIDNF